MKYTQIEVEWEDITFFKGTHAEEDIKDFQTQHIKTIGYLIREEKNYLIIACSVETTEPNRIMDVYKIPKSNIIKKKELK